MIINKIKKAWKMLLGKRKSEDAVIPVFTGRSVNNNERFIPYAVPGPELRLLDINGKDINPSPYYQMIVSGHSCTPFGIRDGNLLLSEKCKNPEKIEFPKVCLFKKDPKGKDQSKFSIAKVWARGTNIEEILQDPNFITSLKDPTPVDLEHIRKHIKDKEIPKNPVIVSWLDNNFNWVLEYRSLQNIIGIAKYSYDI